MKKKALSKVVAVIAAVSMCFGGISAFATEQKDLTSLGQPNLSVSPCFVAIVSYSNNLILNSGGRLTCQGKTSVQYGNIAGVTIELQQYNGGWNTIKTWGESTAITLVSVSNDWYVSSGYQYRLKLTHKAYDSNWNQLESFTSYSKTVSY